MWRPREVFFGEMEAWLRELPFWEECIDEYAMAGPGSSAPKLVPTGKAQPRSIIELQGVNRVVLEQRAAWLRCEIKRLPPRSQEFIHYHYLARTPSGGHSMRQVCRFFELTPEDYHAMRERALLPIIIGLYTLNGREVDLGRPYDFCYHSEGGALRI